MHLILDSFWRAVAYCMHPRVILVSLLPLVLIVGAISGLGYFYLDSALGLVSRWLESFELFNSAWIWLDSVGMGKLKVVLPPIIVIAVVTPVIVMGSLLVVALLMTPVIVKLVGKRRFADLERKQGASFWGSVAWSLGHTVLALLAMVVSIPLWLIPPLVLVLPPLIWGWLSYRVMAFDALAEHASKEERHTLFRRHRLPLAGMGILVGYLGAGPSLIWSFGFQAMMMAPILVWVSIWIYTLIFAFASLWFAHYALAALRDLRREQATPQVLPMVDVLPGVDSADQGLDALKGKEVP